MSRLGCPTASPRKEWSKVTEESRLGASGLGYLEIQEYKSNPIFLGKQHILVPGLLSCKKGGHYCLFLPEVYTEKPERLKRVMSLNMAVDSTVQE